MLSDEMQDALNQQINVEFNSAYSYLALAAYFEDIHLKGFAHWMRIHYIEERMHANKIFDFVIDRDGRVELLAVKEPRKEWGSSLEAFEWALESERSNSEAIYKLAELAMTKHDYATHAFMQWFISEQVEEEALVNDMVAKLQLVGDSNAALFLMDQELAQRPMPTETESEAPGGRVR
jgi:ferritin